jgi:urea transport system permease protein
MRSSLTLPARLLLLLPFWLALLLSARSLADEAARAKLLQAIRAEDAAEQVTAVRELISTDDALVLQALAAWRLGNLFLWEPPDGGTGEPFLVDGATDAEGRSNGLRVRDGKPLIDATGAPVRPVMTDLSPIDTSSKLRRAIKVVLDLHAIADPDIRVRQDAIVKLGQEQEAEYLPHFEGRLSKETEPAVRKALTEAIAFTQLAGEDRAARLRAVATLAEIRSVNSLPPLQKLRTQLATANDPEMLKAVTKAVSELDTYVRWGTLFGTAFRGLSLSAVLLVAALGLAITFGLMGVINMAHGELIMVGAYTAYVVQGWFSAAFGDSGTGYDCYFIVALPASFLAAALVGLALERGIIRFLYRRPLESMLATWGVSLVLQQVFRHIFGAANVQVGSPSWLSGSWVVSDVLLAYNRMFVIAFAVAIVVLTWALMTRTSLGLQIRAVMQNRAMASALGVRTERVNLMTFAFGSGLAGMAGACLSQIGNVGPGLGQNYVVDCFMIVVLGGVGSIPGTVSASLGVGVTDQILQPWLGAVLGKITVLGAIILFLQWRPSGIFASRGRGLEG